MEKFSAENPVYQEVGETPYEVNAEKVMEGVERDVEKILVKIKENIERGEYSAVLGIDGSGRVPALVLQKVIKNIYKECRLDDCIDGFFIAGHSYMFIMPELEEYQRALDVYFDRDVFQEIKNRDKKILIVEDTLESGYSVKPITDILSKKNIPFDFVVSGVVPNYSHNREAVVTQKDINDLGERIGSEVIYGKTGETGSNYGMKQMAGVKKHKSNLFAVRLSEEVLWVDTNGFEHKHGQKPQKDVLKYTRQKVAEIADRLTEKFLNDTLGE
jgi:hypothetical protein